MYYQLMYILIGIPLKSLHYTTQGRTILIYLNITHLSYKIPLTQKCLVFEGFPVVHHDW